MAYTSHTTHNAHMKLEIISKIKYLYTIKIIYVYIIEIHIQTDMYHTHKHTTVIQG